MAQSPNSDTTTHGIRIEAAARFLPEESVHSRYHYVYRIRITNEGESQAQLQSRHWVIIDSHNHREEVVGDGVVGERPDLGPGESFEYTSFCRLRTDWGTMEGTYTFTRADGESFDADIGRFFLVPTADNAITVDK